MKQSIITLTLLLCATLSFAQELKVKSFTHDQMSLEARVGGGRNDLNGRQCALIKVMVRDNIMKCKGGNIGDIVTEGVVKKIFVSPSTKFLDLEFQYNFPLKVTFADYGISSLADGATYTITLVDANMIQQPTQQSSMNPNILPILVNGIAFNMIKVEGGTFTMGATSEQRSLIPNEFPKHKVTISSYFIGETEVTQALWIAVMGNNPSYFEGDNLPVEGVTWDDCQTFICKLNELTNRKFRLPTEAEWEFAARGGNKSKHTQYSGSKKIDDVAWYWRNSGDVYLQGDYSNDKIDKNNCRTNRVKTKKPNELGIYDMSGNVMEWCQDLYGNYTDDWQINPVGTNDGRERVFRGSYYLSRFCHLSERYKELPDFRLRYLGFRLALPE